MVAEEIELYLIRHGLAAERGENYPDDTKRPLTSRGIQKLRREAKALNALDVSFDVILTSPLVRARQTAEALASGLRVPPPVINAPSLAPGGTHNAIVDELAKQSHRRKRMAVVGHEPGIGELAARLLGLRKRVQEGRYLQDRCHCAASHGTGAIEMASDAENAPQDRPLMHHARK
jgi:phosphohistidine phosphatase